MRPTSRALQFVLAAVIGCGAAEAGQATGTVPVSLEAAIAEALARSPALEPALESKALADIGRDRARGEFGFKIAPNWAMSTDTAASGAQLGLSIERRLTTGTGLRVAGDLARDGLQSGSAWAGRYSLTIAQPLLSPLGPVTTARLRDAERGVLSSDRALQESRRELIVRVAQAYFAVVRQQRLADAARRAVERAQQLREASEARTRVGLATQLDVLRADLLASQAGAQLEGQLEALADHRDQLKMLLGRPLDDPIEIDVASVTAALLAAPPADIDALVDTALEARLDLREMRDRVDDARRAASVARWTLMPDLTLEATYTGLAAGTGWDPAGAFRRGWRVRVGTTYAFDQAGARAALAASEIATRAAERRLGDVEQLVEADVRRAARAMERARASIAIQEKAVAIAGQQLALARMRYERGLAGNFDVIDAESNLFQAETSLIAAQVDRAIAVLVLEKAAGTLDPERYRR